MYTMAGSEDSSTPKRMRKRATRVYHVDTRTNFPDIGGTRCPHRSNACSPH